MRTAKVVSTREGGWFDVVVPDPPLTVGDAFDDAGMRRIVIRVVDADFGRHSVEGPCWRQELWASGLPPAVAPIDTAWLSDAEPDSLENEWGLKRKLLEIHDHGGEGTLDDPGYGLTEVWARYASHEPAVILSLLATGHLAMCAGRKVRVTPKGMASIDAIRASVMDEDG